MKKVIWAVSNELGSDSDIYLFVNELEKNNTCVVKTISLEEVLTPSFIPNIDNKENYPVIFYGPVNFISRMEKLNYKPGVYGTPDSFSYEELCRNIPHEYIFNNPNDSFVGNAKEIIEYLKNTNEDVFFKPFRDDKSVIGSVNSVSNITAFCKLVIENKIPDVDNNTKFMTSVPYGIEVEYRLFVINGKIITGSEYKPNNSNIIPENVIEFGNKIINFWNPFPFYVIDVAVSNGNCFVMEIQNFHSAGFYSSDIKEIINKINEYLLDGY